MPLARIDLRRTAPPDRAAIIGNVIYRAMTEVAGVPLHDRFQIVTKHDTTDLIFPNEGYLGIDYTEDLVMIQITWNAGRTIDVKKAFYRFVADEIASLTGIRQQDVWINLIDVVKENWSFGNGEMQYA